MRLLLLFLALALAVLIPFALFGEGLDAFLSSDRLVSWMDQRRHWAWALAIGLLVADLLLPLPATGIMAALGIVYGPMAGSLVAATGSFLAGTTGYLLCRLFGRRAAQRILGPRDIALAERLERHAGGFLVAGSRALPLLPEVVSCMAGLVGMAPARFFTALATGSLITGSLFAALGHWGHDTPALTLASAVIGPALLWIALDRLAGRSLQPPIARTHRRPDDAASRDHETLRRLP